MSNEVERLQDEIAILEYRRGDASALEGLIKRWQRRLYVYVRAVLSDQEAAWDISQEVWLSVVKALRGRREIRSFAAWLYGIAHNKSVTHLRKTGRLKEGVGAEPLEDEAVPDDAPDLVSAADDARVLREALAEVPLAQREALTLFYLDEMSLREIGGILAVPVGTVQSRLHHGRMRLKAILSRKGYGNE